MRTVSARRSKGNRRTQPAAGQLWKNLRVLHARNQRDKAWRPDLPKMSVATEASLIPTSCSTLSKRWASPPCPCGHCFAEEYRLTSYPPACAAASAEVPAILIAGARNHWLGIGEEGGLSP
jgi:hypothetical protein